MTEKEKSEIKNSVIGKSISQIEKLLEWWIDVPEWYTTWYYNLEEVQERKLFCVLTYLKVKLEYYEQEYPISGIQ